MPDIAMWPCSPELTEVACSAVFFGKPTMYDGGYHQAPKPKKRTQEGNSGVREASQRQRFESVLPRNQQNHVVGYEEQRAPRDA